MTNSNLGTIKCKPKFTRLTQPKNAYNEAYNKEGETLKE